MSSRYQRRMVSGVTSPASCSRARRPMALPFAASRRRWASLKRVGAVGKLVKKWDTLHLFTSFTADHEWGDLAWVHAAIGLPVKGGAVPMELFAILVNEPD